jgi:hypothetical protein
VPPGWINVLYTPQQIESENLYTPFYCYSHRLDQFMSTILLSKFGIDVVVFLLSWFSPLVSASLLTLLMLVFLTLQVPWLCTIECKAGPTHGMSRGLFSLRNLSIIFLSISIISELINALRDPLQLVDDWTVVVAVNPFYWVQSLRQLYFPFIPRIMII